MTQTLPIIDLTGLDRDDAAAFARIRAEVARACRGPGFFYVTHHGVGTSLIEDAFAASRGFFARPVAEKAEIAIDRIGNNRGYSGLRNETLDPGKPADLKEAFNIGLELPPDAPDLGDRYRGLNGWPRDPAFRATLLDYFDQCLELGRRLHRVFAADLGLPLDFFADKLDRPMATLRLLHYPPQPPDSAPGQMGAGEHTDYGNITLLMTDDVGGLQVRTRDRGAWIDAPVVPGAFVVNIGDLLMRWTNDVYVSTPHRVANRSGRERYSMAFFLDPDPDALVEAVPSCVPAGTEPLYRPILAADYLTERLDATYAFRRAG